MELDRYDDEADGISPGGRSGVGSLADGKGYDFEFEFAESKTTNNGHWIFKAKVCVIDGPSRIGKSFAIDTFLTTKSKEPDDGEKIVLNDIEVGRLKKNLKSLGFDTENWTKEHGRPFSKELAKAAIVLVGLRGIADKSSRKGDSGTFHDLIFTGRNATADQRPEKFGAAELNAVVEANAEPFAVG